MIGASRANISKVFTDLSYIDYIKKTAIYNVHSMYFNVFNVVYPLPMIPIKEHEQENLRRGG